MPESERLFDIFFVDTAMPVLIFREHRGRWAEAPPVPNKGGLTRGSRSLWRT